MKSIYNRRYIALVGKLKQRRLELGLHQTAVAAQLGHTNRWLSKVERMDIRLDIMTFILVCRALRLSAHRMVRRIEAELDEEEDPPFTYQSDGGYPCYCAGMKWASWRRRAPSEPATP